MRECISFFPGRKTRMAPSAFFVRCAIKCDIKDSSTLCWTTGESDDSEAEEGGEGGMKFVLDLVSFSISGNQWMETGKVRPGMSSEEVE